MGRAFHLIRIKLHKLELAVIVAAFFIQCKDCEQMYLNKRVLMLNNGVAAAAIFLFDYQVR
ncbi:hypothetical protein [Lederbergia citrea]|uniref:hypothetical protein n=1 Tax=Lederbergia citrea TaxID=2833581 RepID=UPI001BC975B7|nr:hypothetical protein [Lederbergia citrea]MBS4176990.1 hypothetical protein [Lederbergia citrea]MBS4203564.1 hypothetical protein [Lederbergia citrea]